MLESLLRRIMKRHIAIFASFAILEVLAACGGGGASTASSIMPSAPSVTPNPVATPTPTPAPSGPPHPSAAGDMFAFTGSMVQNDTYTYPVGSPLPATSSTAKVSQAVTVFATANPNGGGQVQDFHSVETDAYPAQTVGETTDYYFKSGSTFSLIGYASTDGSGNRSTMMFTAPQVVDQIPETTGASWTNNPAGQLSQTFIDGKSATRTIASNGTYVDSVQVYGTTTNYPSIASSVTENPDGSGVFQIIYYENGRAGYQPNEVVYQNYAVSPPTAQSTNAQFLYITSQNYPVYFGSPSPPTPSPYATLPIWYTSPLSLYGESDKNLGTTAVPASCNLPASLGTTATEIQQTVTSTDTVLGMTTATTTKSYVVDGYGPVCVQLSSTVSAYYDYNKDTYFGAILYQATPMQTTTYTESLTLQPQQSYQQIAGKVTTHSGSAFAAITPAEIAIARLRLKQRLVANRFARIRSISEALTRQALGKKIRK